MTQMIELLGKDIKIVIIIVHIVMEYSIHL